jgi:hypothetical protein
MAGALKRSLGVLGAVLLTVALVELGAVALVRARVLDAPRPHRGHSALWWHQHPGFGAWHRPDAAGDHVGACYRARYRTNSVGARDVERPRRASGPRVVVLGDSFLEGYGVEADSRLSEMLEAATGVPHLNFAMASFGPYQELLVYEALARQFDHTAVMVSVFPGNDFADMDPEGCAELGDPDYCFRPFPGPPPALERIDRLEPAWRSFLKAHSQTFMVILAVARARHQARTTPRSLFYEFDEAQAVLLEAVLERIRTAAEGKQLIVLLIPKLHDLESFVARGPDPLSARLEAWAVPRGVRVVNLLPGMAVAGRRWSSYYLPCDFHWSRWGNRVAAELTLEALADLYPPGAALRQP